MTLLIVDDEELTRNGLLSSIDWPSLGIQKVLQADDGIRGLEMARLHRPEIILCDVRMPRLDGITMLKQLEDTLPDCVPIFMSGYSDKEYLKAAIRLKAVSYIEKPLNPSEVREAVQDARAVYEQRLRTHRGDAIHSRAAASSLAARLTVPFSSDNEEIYSLAAELSLAVEPPVAFTAVILRLNTYAEAPRPPFDEIQNAFLHFLEPRHLNSIYVEKRVEYLVYFIFGSRKPDRTDLASIGDFLGNQFAPYGKYYLASGDTVTGISRAYESYASAVVLLQSGFFFPAGTFLTADLLREVPEKPSLSPLPEAPETFLLNLLLEGNHSECISFLGVLSQYLDRNHTQMVNQVRDLYYRLFISVREARKQKQLSADKEESQGSIMEALDGAFTFQELHSLLKEKTEKYFSDLENAVAENSTIYQIKDYISKNYMNVSLSVKDISSHVFLSTSYVCTFFKNETGQTLNQYLTEYRMEKAKQLLSDPRYKISDISARVGYADGSYFGKSFRKYSGLSPSDYREKMS
ncbi:MAG: response regulator [Clostridiales bacterium]|nr:response regulator [Clostridiales bacterium]